MKVSQKAYTAGIIDGEGAIMLTSQGRLGGTSMMLTIEVSQREDKKDILDLLQVWWGGRVVINRYHQKHGGSLHYYWSIQSKPAKKVLLKVLPFLIAKKEQAKLGIAFQILRDAFHKDMIHKPQSQRKVDDEIGTLYDALRQAMQGLNGSKKATPVTETERRGLISIARTKAASYRDEDATVHPTQIANA